MTYEEAKAILGSRATWELHAIIRALEWCELINTPEENQRLQAARILRKGK